MDASIKTATPAAHQDSFDDVGLSTSLSVPTKEDAPIQNKGRKRGAISQNNSSNDSTPQTEREPSVAPSVRSSKRARHTSQIVWDLDDNDDRTLP